jgi:hypothetical protein
VSRRFLLVIVIVIVIVVIVGDGRRITEATR